MYGWFVRTGMALAASALVCFAPAEVKAGVVSDMPSIWAAEAAGSLRGDVSCVWGSPGCNVCATRVDQQFANVRAAAFVDDNHYSSWAEYVWLAYPPTGASILRFPGTLPNSHFQGMAHLSFSGIPDVNPDIFLPQRIITVAESNGFWLATSMGDDDPHGIALSWIAQSLIGSTSRHNRGGVRYFFAAPGAGHVGGIHAIGKYLLSAYDQGDSNTSIDILDLSKPSGIDYANSRGIARVRIGRDFGLSRIASVAAAKLAMGGYLVASQRRTTCDGVCQYIYDFFHAPSLDSASGWILLGSLDLTRPAENLALVTDCQSGTIHMIGAAGPSVGAPNWWTRWGLKGNSGKPEFTTFATSAEPAFSASCRARGAATAYADNRGRLVLGCHEKMPDNVEDTITGEKLWEFEEWTTAP